MPIIARHLQALPVTKRPGFHWFGYYDKFPWDVTGRYLLTLEVDFMDRPPQPGDVARIAMVDLKEGNRLIPLAETQAFNWQQGTHLQWMPTAPDREIIYNVLVNDHYEAVIQDVFTGKKRSLPLPIYALSPDGKRAVTLNFSRVHSCRPGYGYNHLMHKAGPDVPDDDGIWLMDLTTGAHKLVVTIRQIYETQTRDEFVGARHWFNHLQFNTAGTRFVFLHRWRHTPTGPFKTRMFTANADGSDVYLLNPEGASHFDWEGPDKILVFAPVKGVWRYHLHTDRTDKVEVVGADVFKGDGHCSYSPDRRWILTDTYQDKEQKRTLILYRIADNLRVDVGRFYSMPLPKPDPHYEVRCDLHPRWSRDGRQVCFDSTHEKERQVYVMDVSPIVSLP